MGAAVDDTAYGSALHELWGVSAVLGVPSELAVVERLELVVQGVLRRADEAVAAEHPEHKLSRPRVAPAKLRCVECGGEFEGRRGKLICSRRCKDRRYARLHPEALREKQRRKYARRKAA